VAGAGWAGLSCALALADAGARVTVFEASRTAGGRARSVAINGDLLDNGQHILIGAYERCLYRIASLGPVDDALLRLELAMEVPGRFKFRTPHWPAPLHIVAGVIGAQGLSFADKTALLLWMCARKLEGFKAPQQLTVEQWCQGLPRTVLHWMIEPLCVSALNTPASEASAVVFAAVLRDSLGSHRAASDLLIPRIPLSAIFPDRAIAKLRSQGVQVEMGSAVHAIHAIGNAWRIDRADGKVSETSNASAATAFDGVVLATAPWITRGLLSNMQRLELEQTIVALDRLRYEPITTVYFRPAHSLSMSAPMVAMEPDIVKQHYGQFLFDKTSCGGPPGWYAVVVSAATQCASLDGAALVARCAEQVAALLNQSVRPVQSKVITEKRATYACTPGLHRPGNVTALSGLYIAGDFTAGDYPATLEQAVRSGEAAAESALAKWGHRSKTA
jgi:squalene-associated FAD-dependent desaturase